MTWLKNQASNSCKNMREFVCAARQSHLVCNSVGVMTNTGNDERNDVDLTTLLAMMLFAQHFRG